MELSAPIEERIIATIEEHTLDAERFVTPEQLYQRETSQTPPPYEWIDGYLRGMADALELVAESNRDRERRLQRG